jgi:hypothetical protein
MSAIQMLRPAQLAAEEDGSLHRDLFRWLARMASVVNLGIVPPKGIIWANLSADDIADSFDANGLGNRGSFYDGWQICNGSNGSPDIRDRFVRTSGTGAGATGGSDSSAHTHDVDLPEYTGDTGAGTAHSHGVGTIAIASESGHTHSIDHDHGSFTSGSESAHTHGGGNLFAQIASNSGGTTLQARVAAPFASWTANNEYSVAPGGVSIATTRGTPVAGTSAAGSAHSHSIDPPNFTGTSGAGSSHTHAITGAMADESAHTHSNAHDHGSVTSGAASAADNRPAYYELVALMRLDIGG